MIDDRLKVLVIDDEAAMREVLEMRLKQWGFEVVVAKNAAEALAKADTESPDAVISDLVLPDISGLDLVERLQGGPEYRPVIMITGMRICFLARFSCSSNPLIPGMRTSSSKQPERPG